LFEITSKYFALLLKIIDKYFASAETSSSRSKDDGISCPFPPTIALS
jgi:hypothetical protein